MPRTHSGHAARKNLAALLHELREDVGAFVVDEVHLLDAKLAHFLLAEILAFTTTRTAWSTTTWSAFSAWAAMTTAGTSMAAGTTFTPRCTARRLCLLLLFCHASHPFPSDPARVSNFRVSQSARFGLVHPSTDCIVSFCYCARIQLAVAVGSGAGAAAAAGVTVVRRGRRAALFSRRSVSFFCRFKSSSRRTV